MSDERAPVDFTEQSINALKHEIEHPYTHGRGRPYIQLDLDDARNILAELERLRAHVDYLEHKIDHLELGL